MLLYSLLTPSLRFIYFLHEDIYQIAMHLLLGMMHKGTKNSDYQQ